MRWWASLRQAYPNRSRIALGIAVLLFCFVVGGALIGGTAAALHLTSTESFCISLPRAARQRVRRIQGHHPRQEPHRRARRVRGLPSAERVRADDGAQGRGRARGLGPMTGYIDTPEKYEKARHAMAVREWTRMKKNDSQECRNCHTVAAMDPEKQSETARARTPRRKPKAPPASTAISASRTRSPMVPGPGRSRCRDESASRVCLLGSSFGAARAGTGRRGRVLNGDAKCTRCHDENDPTRCSPSARPSTARAPTRARRAAPAAMARAKRT